MNTPVKPRRILVWDFPTRLFHWSLAACFAGAWLTSDSERQQFLHFLFGYSLLGLIAFRLVWGVVGSRYARFSEFVRGPGAVVRYLRSLWRREEAHGAGHNPAGAVAIVLLLVLGLGTSISGWLMASGRAGESLEEVHEALATAMLALVVVHVLAVIVSSVLHRQNLVRAMVTGYKQGLPAQGIRSGSAAVAMVLGAALCGFWAYGLGTQRLPFGLGAVVEGNAADATSHGESGRDAPGERDDDD